MDLFPMPFWHTSYRFMLFLVHFVNDVKHHVHANCIHSIGRTIAASHHNLWNPLNLRVSKCLSNANGSLIMNIL